jgi:hypothetical protein
MLVQNYGQKAKNALVALHIHFQSGNQGRRSGELYQIVESRLLLVDGVRKLAQAPTLYVDDGTTGGFNAAGVFIHRFPYLIIRQDGI